MSSMCSVPVGALADSFSCFVSGIFVPRVIQQISRSFCWLWGSVITLRGLYFRHLHVGRFGGCVVMPVLQCSRYSLWEAWDFSVCMHNVYTHAKATR